MFFSNGYSPAQYAAGDVGGGPPAIPSPPVMHDMSTFSTFPNAPLVPPGGTESNHSGRRMPSLTSSTVIGGTMLAQSTFVVHGGVPSRQGVGAGPVTPNSNLNGPSAPFVMDQMRYGAPPALPPSNMVFTGAVLSGPRRILTPSSLSTQISPTLQHSTPQLAMPTCALPLHPHHQYTMHATMRVPPSPSVSSAPMTLLTGGSLPPPLFSGGGPPPGFMVNAQQLQQGGSSSSSRRKVPHHTSSGSGGFSSTHSDSSHTSKRSTASQGTTGMTRSAGMQSHSSVVVGPGGQLLGSGHPLGQAVAHGRSGSGQGIGASTPTYAQGNVSYPLGTPFATNNNITNTSLGGVGPTATTTKPPPSQPSHDEHRRRQRRKQIAFGKVTEGYSNYRSAVPLFERQHGNLDHPVTPDVNASSSKRHWDAQISEWRRALHKWDDPNGPTGHRRRDLETMGQRGLVAIESIEESRRKAMEEIARWRQEVSQHREFEGQTDDAPRVGTLMHHRLSPYIGDDGGAASEDSSAVVGHPVRPASDGSGSARIAPGETDESNLGYVRAWQHSSLHYDPSIYHAPSASGSINNPPSTHSNYGGGGSSLNGFVPERYQSSHDGGDSNCGSDSCASRETPRSGNPFPIGSGFGKTSGGGRGSAHGTFSSRGATFTCSSGDGIGRVTNHSSGSSVNNNHSYHKRNESYGSSSAGGGGGGGRGATQRRRSIRGGVGENSGSASFSPPSGGEVLGSKSLGEGPATTICVTGSGAHVLSILLSERQLEQQGLAAASAGGRHVGRSNSNLGSSGHIGTDRNNGSVPHGVSEPGSSLSTPQTPSIGITNVGLAVPQPQPQQQAADFTISIPLVADPKQELPRPLISSPAYSPETSGHREEAFVKEIERTVAEFINVLSQRFNLSSAYWLPHDTVANPTGSPAYAVSPSLSTGSLSPAGSSQPLVLNASLLHFKSLVTDRVTRGVCEAFSRRRRENQRVLVGARDLGALSIPGLHASATGGVGGVAAKSSHGSDLEDENRVPEVKYEVGGSTDRDPTPLTWLHVTDTIVLPSIVYTGSYNPYIYADDYDDDEEEDYEQRADEDGGVGLAGYMHPADEDATAKIDAYGDELLENTGAPQFTVLPAEGRFTPTHRSVPLGFNPELILEKDPQSPLTVVETRGGGGGGSAAVANVTGTSP